MSRRSSLMVSRTLYQLGVMTLMTSIFWAALGVYRAVQDPVDVNVDEKLVEPLSPLIDQEVLAKLARRRAMSESDFQKLVEWVDEQERARVLEERALVRNRVVEQPVVEVVEEETEEATGSGVAQP